MTKHGLLIATTMMLLAPVASCAMQYDAMSGVARMMVMTDHVSFHSCCRCLVVLCTVVRLSTALQMPVRFYCLSCKVPATG